MMPTFCLDGKARAAKAFDLLTEGYGRRQSDGASYSIFEAKGETKPGALGKLPVDKTHELMHLFVQTNVTILELAATIDWLWRFENRKDWCSEIKKRKSVKAREDRLDKAVQLLTDLGLTPPAPVTA